MLDFGKRTKFIPNGTRSLYGILEVLKFYELIGINIICIDIGLTDIKSMNLNILNIFNVKKLTSTIADLEKTINDNSFRVDLVIIQNPKSYFIDTSFSKIPIIIIDSPNYDAEYNHNYLYDYTYIFSVKDGPMIFTPGIQGGIISSYSYFVEDIDNNWKVSLDDLKITYIRNKKLEDLGL